MYKFRSHQSEGKPEMHRKQATQHKAIIEPDL